MKYFSQILILILLLPVSTTIFAVDSTGLIRSAGKLSSDSSVELNNKLADSPVLVTDEVKSRTFDNDYSSISNLAYRSAQHGIATEFQIFDAWVELAGDIDNDGYFHRIKTTFDADVNTAVETVYASLYLSYEGGNWKQVADTDLYEIYYDSINDSYEIVTELIEGYPPGYYDVLIELHSFFHNGIVASRIITQDIDGYSITLEDLQHDDYYMENENHHPVTDLYITAGPVHAGSFSWAGLIMFAMLLLIKFRYFSNKSEKQ